MEDNMRVFKRHGLATVLMGIGMCLPVAAGAAPKTGPGAASESKPANKAEVTDAQILGIADVANTGEVGQANIALSKGQADSVKQFAQLMVKDHTAAKEKGRAVGKELGLTPAPSELSNGVQRDGNEATAQLEKASTRNFDRTYMQIQVRLHEKVLKTLDDLIPKADASQVKTLLTDMRGHVEHHLAVARSTLKSLEK
jgi:putative membrane protein